MEELLRRFQEQVIKVVLRMSWFGGYQRKAHLHLNPFIPPWQVAFQKASPHKHCVESLGPNESPLFLLGK